MLLPYQSNITTIIVYARPQTMFWLIINFLFSFHWNYALVLVLKVQVKLCTSMNLFSRIREREKLKWIKQWFDYFIEKKTNKQTSKQKAHLVDILPTHKTFDKFWSGSPEKFPPLLPPTPVRQRMFTSTNQSADRIWPTWFSLTARALH